MYNSSDIEKKWNKIWEETKIYNYNEKIGRNNTFVVDTPPPTVSGSLHIGHIFSYTQTDIIVRYKRMQGMNIFFPIGWDDNGLPTERRVQNYFGIKCNPNLPYDPNWKADISVAGKNKDVYEVSRKNFIEACAVLAEHDEVVFEDVFKSVGHSYDWRFKYATIDEKSRKISQRSFLDLVQKKLVYMKEMPTMWDVTFQSAVANAEVEDREMNSVFYDIQFKLEDGTPFVISTTRPELLPACIAVAANPNDSRYQKYFGKTAVTPGFFTPVKIYPSDHVEMDKGTGIMMICTFGDINDVEWWRQSGLPMKQIISKNGRINDVDFGNGVFKTRDPKGVENFKTLVGLNLNAARKKTIEILEAENAIVGKKDIVHAVKFYEKGDRPIEFIKSRQWFVDILSHKDALIKAGRKINWYPKHMQTRYEHWVEGINQDWCISRQRFFGVPFPLWYKIDAEGNVLYDEPIFADVDALPIDPMIDVPSGYTESQRGQKNGFIGDNDVMDTWATSALTPQIASNWTINNTMHDNLFPSDLRAQSHDIIRTWAFYTIAKSLFHEDNIPWKNITVSGFIVDPDRKKMSKSKGNVVTPGALIEKYSADAVRYWAAKAKLGADTIYDESLFQIGKKLVTKIYNAGNFVKTILDKSGVEDLHFSINDIITETDKIFVKKLKNLVTVSSKFMHDFEYSAALQNIEDLFWNFCDNYIELVKTRAYGDQTDASSTKSALATLHFAYKLFLKLFAPFIPYVTEEAYREILKEQTSVHIAMWPRLEDFGNVDADDVFDKVTEILDLVRAEKSKQQKSVRAPLEYLKISIHKDYVDMIKKVIQDIAFAMNVDEAKVEIESLIEDITSVNTKIFD